MNSFPSFLPSARVSILICRKKLRALNNVSMKAPSGAGAWQHTAERCPGEVFRFGTIQTRTPCLPGSCSPLLLNSARRTSVQIAAYASPFFDLSFSRASFGALARRACAQSAPARRATDADHSRRSRRGRERCGPPTQQRLHQSVRDRRAECRHHRGDEEKPTATTLPSTIFFSRRRMIAIRITDGRAGAGAERRLRLHR